MRKVFIGGSRKISRLNKDIRYEIDNIINNGYTIIIGDANGIDKSIQYYLNLKKYDNVIIFCMGEICRNNIGNWKENHINSNLPKKNINYYCIKDVEMAKEADYGFMIWDGKSKGTFKNIINLLEEEKNIIIYLSSMKKFYNINNYNDFNIVINQSDVMPLFKDYSIAIKNSYREHLRNE